MTLVGIRIALRVANRYRRLLPARGRGSRPRSEGAVHCIGPRRRSKRPGARSSSATDPRLVHDEHLARARRSGRRESRRPVWGAFCASDGISVFMLATGVCPRSLVGNPQDPPERPGAVTNKQRHEKRRALQQPSCLISPVVIAGSFEFAAVGSDRLVCASIEKLGLREQINPIDVFASIQSGVLDRIPECYPPPGFPKGVSPALPPERRPI